jgi:hypothetical protein
MHLSYQQKAQEGEVDLIPAPPESYSCHVCRQDVGARVSVDQVINPFVDLRMHDPILWLCRSIWLGHATTCEEGTMSLA